MPSYACVSFLLSEIINKLFLKILYQQTYFKKSVFLFNTMLPPKVRKNYDMFGHKSNAAENAALPSTSGQSL